MRPTLQLVRIVRGLRWKYEVRVRTNYSIVCQTRSLQSEASQYVRKSPREHVLLRPDTYIGSTNVVEMQSSVYDETLKVILTEELAYPPGLIKIFDEILVNAADNKQRDPNMDQLHVNIDRSTGLIEVWNNGKGLPIEIHPTEDIYVPTLIFGSLFTSSNYDDRRIKTVGGRNGYGAKLCNIYSTTFTVESGSSENEKVFKQTWHNNMATCGDAIIKSQETPDFTKISFFPDLEKFHLTNLTDDIFKILQRRVVDVAGTLEGVAVYFNEEKVEIDSFHDYVNLYTNNFSYFNISPRWKVAVAPNVNGLNHISFVNNVNTIKGGTHVDYIVDQIVNIFRDAVNAKLGRKVNLRPSLIKNNITVFVNAIIENPSFDSQTKEYLNTRIKDFGSQAIVNAEKLVAYAEQSGLLESLTDLVQTRKTAPKSMGLEVIAKLEDAYHAGSSKSANCSLIVTEGDSAKALAVAGLEVVGRDLFGVFPIRGKLINVSQMSFEKTILNVEISNLVKILGLQEGTDYSDDAEFNRLRYGQCVILSDQDADGSHIKGLLLYFFYKFWPSLVERGYVSSLRTPLIKARRGSEVKSFYNLEEFRTWKASTSNSGQYSIKYYKGLGTSTSQEAREYFASFRENLVSFSTEDVTDGDKLNMVFDNKRIEDRKNWIQKRYENGLPDSTHPSKNFNSKSLQEFVDTELIEFSLLHLKRSIPCVVDGLKPSQRKILHTLLQRTSSAEMKVNQLAGAVSLQQAYHHGEESLVNTIVRMAQSFTGSNNLPLLEGLGQFGTRHEGGMDAASARYIYTKLSPLTRLIFPASDDSLLEHIVEENQTVEPVWYCPIIPMILINGSEGIGTGWATRILNHKVTDVVDNLKRLIDNRALENMLPYWNNFTGTVLENGNNQYHLKGRLKLLKNFRGNRRVEISELPAGVWTSKYKERVLALLLKNGIIKDVKEHHTETKVLFELTLTEKGVPRNDESLTKLFKMTSVLSNNSMVLYDAEDRLRKFESVTEIFKHYFVARQKLYEKRKSNNVATIRRQFSYCEQQIRFIEMILDGRVNVRQSTSDILRCLQELEFISNPMQTVVKEDPDYNYLLKMPINRLTTEETHQLKEKRNQLELELTRNESASWQDMWMQDIEQFEQFHRKYNKK